VATSIQNQRNEGRDPPRIRVVSLTKRYNRRGGGTIIPVDNVSLDVAAEEMVVLLGPSGCGKTTLLRCVAGLERPEEGEIYVNDVLVFSSKRGIFVPPNERPVSMVFQSYALWPHMTLAQNVAYPLRARKVPAGEIGGRVDEALETVGLLPLAAQYPGQISGGQQQRVALARAIVAQTGTVLFDEPLSNVDAKVREQLRLEIRRMQRTFGFSALYVTHDQGEAMAVADRIAVLGNGRIEQLGSAEAVYGAPTSTYVGNFIGMANMWSGAITSVDGPSLTLATALGDLTVGCGPEDRHGIAEYATGRRATAFIRPEAVTLSDTPGQGVNERPCTVEARVFLGSHTEYVLVVGNERIRAWIPSAGRIAEGAAAWVSFDPSRIRLLPDEGTSHG
jgi:ABC-type Fe3+/spermidine/putrescine transport system ATPase subunit